MFAPMHSAIICTLFFTSVASKESCRGFECKKSKQLNAQVNASGLPIDRVMLKNVGIEIVPPDDVNLAAGRGLEKIVALEDTKMELSANVDTHDKMELHEERDSSFPLDKSKGVASEEDISQASDSLLLADLAKDYWEHKGDTPDKYYIQHIRDNAYGPAKQRIQLSLNLSVDQIYVDAATNALGYVGEWNSSQLGPYWNQGGFPSKVVAFKPSAGSKDWWYDVKSAKSKAVLLGPHGGKSFEVGSGFADQYLSLRNKGFSPELICRGHPYVLVTGDSLGGALSNIGAHDLFEWGCRVKHISFSSPRVFTSATAATIQDDIESTRWMTNCDPVPQVPFSAMGYKHIGKPYVMSAGADACNEEKHHQAYRQDQDFSGNTMFPSWDCHAVYGSQGYDIAMRRTQTHSTEGCSSFTLLV